MTLTGRRLRSLLDDFFVTAEQLQLPVRYRAAACNTLCGFLEQGSQSTSPKLREICLNRFAWRRLLSLYLERFQDPTSKPMKQVLSTLIKLLDRKSEQKADQACDNASTLLEDAASRSLSFISSHEDLSFIKPAMLFLDTIISKKTINLRTLISLLPSDTSVLSATSSETMYYLVQSFVASVIRWARQIDIVSAAGKLLNSFFSEYNASGGNKVFTSLEILEPPWFQPVNVEISNGSPAVVEILEKQILPGLLRTDPNMTLQTLRSLPLSQLANGSIGSVSERNIRFCLLVLKILGDMKSDLDLSTLFSLSISITD